MGEKQQTITVGHLYPDLLNLYGDRGNIACLQQRCRWRGIEAKVKEFHLGEQIDFTELDIVLLGGGSDREQAIVCRELSSIKEQFRQYVEDDGVVIAVCGGYQLLGSYYQTKTEKIEGLGLVDLYTVQEEGRLIGNIVLKSELCDMPIVGFENHGGRTYIGSGRPFGEVVAGYGNDGKSGYEGVLYKNVIGTYLHGPLLPKNPQISDHLIRQALLRKYKEADLKPLEDELESQANACMYRRILGEQKG